MQQLDREVVKSEALIIDGNPTSRSVMFQSLREFGFGVVKAASRVMDAREILERRRFDVVICDYHFEHGNESGQDLLEELRRENLLPYSTVFIMVTGEATYQKVAEAAEAALDSYLIKPFSANTLFERLKEARQRKRELHDIFASMDAKQFELAAQLCLNRFNSRGMYWLYAARIGAEVLLMLKRNVEAKRLFDAVIEAKAVPWARLGIARVQLAEGGSFDGAPHAGIAAGRPAPVRRFLRRDGQGADGTGQHRRSPAHLPHRRHHHAGLHPAAAALRHAQLLRRRCGHGDRDAGNAPGR